MINDDDDEVAQEEMKPLNRGFQNCNPVQNRVNHYREIATRTWPKNYTFVRFAADRKLFMTSFRSKCKDYRGLPGGKFCSHNL